jgi:acetylglutamate kinase
MEQLTIVKIGGKIIDQKEKLHSFLNDFHAVPGRKILVHGGGMQATDIGDKMGVRSRYINGRRITDDDVLKLVTMVYGGLINKDIVAFLQSIGCNAIGLTGADGNAINARKRPVADIDYGYVGDVDEGGVNKNVFVVLLNAGLIPVLAPLTHDGLGNLLNTNADTIAQETGKALTGMFDICLVYCFEKRGVLQNAADDNSVISTICVDDFDRLKREQVIAGGMIPKLENAFAAIDEGVHRVVIGHASELSHLVDGKSGTHIR